MNILFMHRDYPAQFKYLVLALANDPNNNIMFITEDKTLEINNVKKFVYTPLQKTCESHPYLNFSDEILCHARGAMKVLQDIKKTGVKLDIIYGFGFWGLNMFAKDVFPDVPVLSYCEWFYNSVGADVGFDGQVYTDDVRAQIRFKNATMLVGLCSCDAAITPTQWQKEQFPKEFHDKIRVIHDGIDTNTCAPNPNAKFLIKDKNLELGISDEVITYGTRGMEPYRGFPQFMEAAEKLLKKRPKAHIVIAGADNSYYGPKPQKGTYKEHMLSKLKMDLSRVHFVGGLSFSDYINLLQISSVHVYATFPYILSWSILNALATGCCVVASSTPPVLEVIKDNYNGLLYDFYNIDQLVEKVEYALVNQDKMQVIRANARQSILDNYEIMKMLVAQMTYIQSLIQQNRRN